MEVVADGYWAESAVWVPPAETPLDLVLYPLSEVEGRLEGTALSAGTQLDLAFKLYKVGARGEQTVEASGTVSCPVKKARFRCSIPAGQLDLRIAAQGFGPAYFWDLNLPRGQTLDLQPVYLRAGASIIGWLTRPDIEQQTRVVAWKKGLGLEIAALEHERSGLVAFEGVANEKGFFQVDGLATGIYVIRAIRGKLRSPVIQIEIPQTDQEVVLSSTVDLLPPESMTLFLDPVVDPTGEPWAIELIRSNGGGGKKTARASIAGVAAFTELDFGRYQLKVLDVAGSRWLSQALEVLPSMEPLVLTLALVPVRGSLFLGKKRASGEVVFGSTTGPLSISMTADDEGNFEGHLPNEGPWRVEVQLLEVDGAQAADKTEIRRKPGESYAEVEIRLPDTRVSGLVLRDNRPAEAFVVGIIERDGRSVPEAAAVARRQFSVATESDGSFEVRGLSPGKIRVFAHDGERQSDKVLVELVDGVDPQELMLELAVMEDIYGALVDQGNGVPGAAIMVVPEKGVRRQTTTDWTGSFQTRVRADSSYVNLIVVPPAGGVFVQRVSTGRESKEIVLFLRREEGNLLVPSDTLSTLHYVFSGGSMVPLQPLGSALTGYSRVAVEDGDVLFAGLSPGVWNLCPHPVLDPSSCHTVEVLQGQTARLQRMEERE